MVHHKHSEKTGLCIWAKTNLIRVSYLFRQRAVVEHVHDCDGEVVDRLRLDVGRVAVDREPRGQHGLLEAAEAIIHERGCLHDRVIIRLRVDTVRNETTEDGAGKEPEHLGLVGVLKDRRVRERVAEDKGGHPRARTSKLGKLLRQESAERRPKDVNLFDVEVRQELSKPPAPLVHGPMRIEVIIPTHCTELNLALTSKRASLPQ
jgi:hypothetical protein